MTTVRQRYRRTVGRTDEQTDGRLAVAILRSARKKYAEQRNRAIASVFW